MKRNVSAQAGLILFDKITGEFDLVGLASKLFERWEENLYETTGFEIRQH